MTRQGSTNPYITKYIGGGQVPSADFKRHRRDKAIARYRNTIVGITDLRVVQALFSPHREWQSENNLYCTAWDFTPVDYLDSFGMTESAFKASIGRAFASIGMIEGRNYYLVKDDDNADALKLVMSPEIRMQQRGAMTTVWQQACEKLNNNPTR